MLASDTGCLADHGRTSQQNDWIANLLKGIAIAAAGYNAYKAFDIAKAEWKMAKRYWDLSKKWLDYYKNYFAPVEDQELAEAMNQPKEKDIYVTARGRARAVAWMSFKNKLDSALRCSSRYCTGLREDMLMELSAAQANAVALADGLGYRNERAYLEARDDVRFKRMLETAKRGRDMVADNVSLAKTTAGIYGDLYDQAWNGLKGAGAYIGYIDNRNATAYPNTFLGKQGYGDGRAKFVPSASRMYSPGVEEGWESDVVHGMDTVRDYGFNNSNVRVTRLSE